MEIQYKSAKQAWDELLAYRWNYYDNPSAMYCGDHRLLALTGETKSFWKRSGAKGKIHVPIVADIAATSANILFGQEPTFAVFHDDTELNESDQQKRLENILDKNNFESKLNEAAETCAVLGDVFLKLRWDVETGYPMIDVVQADNALPEFVYGKLVCLHTFTDLFIDTKTNQYTRVYERYTKGNIHMEVYRGDSGSLGMKLMDGTLEALGYQEEIKCPVDEMLAVHIANVKPNRMNRSSMLGRSDFEGLRDLCDALDETYSSWIRDIRLAKAKLIVPVDYLRRKPQEMLDGVAQNGSWEFDPDIETYVAMDIQTADNASGNYITPSQFDIRSQEHADTCTNLIQQILQLAGYSPQTFGMEINGSSSSGTALNIRERKSAATRDKKQTYWIAPLEHLLTVMLQIDHALYPSEGSDGSDKVSMKFADSMGYDILTMAQTVQAITSAQAASTETKVRMLHQDWNEQEIVDECDKIAQEYAVNTNGAIDMFGNPVQNVEEPTE